MLPLLAGAGAASHQTTRLGLTGYDIAARNGCAGATAALERLGMREIGQQQDDEHRPHGDAPAARRDELGVGRGTREGREGVPPPVVGCGSNLSGQLGQPSTATSTTLLPVSMPIGEVPIGLVSCGDGHTLFATKGGAEVFGCGSNVHGQLGLGVKTAEGVIAQPTRVAELCGHGLVALACGDSHTLALDRAGRVRCCGNNSHGQLGLGSTEPNVHLPELNELSGVRAVGAGSFTTFFLVATESPELEVRACGAWSMLHGGGSAVVATPVPVDELKGRGVVRMSCSATSAFFLTATGTVLQLAGQLSQFRLQRE